MKTVTEKKIPKRIVTESLRIDACGQGDELQVPFTRKGHWNSVGRIIVSKIKAIPGDRVQVKYVQRHSGTKKVMKTDLPADLIVERSREATEADGPDAGVPEIRTATHEGIPYRAIDPNDDVDELIIAAVQSGMGEGRSLTSMIGLGQLFAERAARPSSFDLPGGFVDDIEENLEGRHRALARGLVENVAAMTGSSRDAGSGLGRSLAMQHVAGLAAAGLVGPHDEAEDRDPDMRRMGDWLGAFEDRGILRPGAKEKLMGSIWTEDELRDGRPNPGSVIIDG